MKKQLLAIALSIFPLVGVGQQNNIISISRDKIALGVHGLADTVNILHLTDSHITIANEDDEKYMEYAKRMANAYKDTRHYKSGKPTAASDVFMEQMRYAGNMNVDFIGLTGDILNYPSPTAVNFVKETIDSTMIPYLFTSGNHDWHMEGTDGSADKLREQWSKEVLSPLYNGANYLYSSKVVKGVNFITIDNSTYQVNKQQLNFFCLERAKGLPIVLLMHIPLYTPTSTAMVVGNPSWGAHVDNNYKLERREQWSKEGNSTWTVDFVNEVINTPNVTILCGHTHQELLNVWGNMVQICADISRNGSARIIQLVPIQ